MPNYVDGFVFPVAREHLEDYKRVAESVAEVYKEHGALDYIEFVGDDMTREGTRAFPEMVGAAEDEVVVFGWIVFASRADRDSVNNKVESDPRMADLVAPIMDPSKPIFDAAKMAYGGFKTLVESSQS